MAHRRTPRIYAPRRVPQSFSPAYTAMRLRFLWCQHSLPPEH